VRVAVVSDIHGNLPALDAVLAELHADPPDAVVLGGDIAAGPQPVAVLERLRSLPWPVHPLRGNADRFVVMGYDGTIPEHLLDQPLYRADAWTATFLERADRDWLETLPPVVRLEPDRLGDVLFCHATPRSDEEIFTERDSDDVVAGMLEGVEERTVVCGHTHIQHERRVGPWRVINAGSVGIAYGVLGAQWALLGSDVELRQTDYDRQGAARLIRETGWFESGDRERKQHLVEALVEGHPKEEVLDFFDQWAAQQRGS
jgi:predicted phosphodiesterase